MSALTHAEALAAIKEGRVTTAALIVQALPLVAEQLLIDAQTTDDPDLRRKIFETLQKSLDSVEPKQAQTSFQVAHLTIVTNGRQSPVEFVQEVALPEPKPAPLVLEDTDSLAELAESLLGVEDE